MFLFTPSFGLFDTLHHGRLASTHVKNGQRAFDYATDGSPITFSDAWEPFRLEDASHFLEMPITAVLAIMATMFVFHIFASTCVLKLSLRKRLTAKLLVRGLHTLIVPPLHYDWELFYRQDLQQNSSVLTCWKRYVFKCMYLQ